MQKLVEEAQTLSATALKQVRRLTEELIAARTDRNREHNFRLFFQKQALEYERRYHKTVEGLILERLSHGKPPDQF